MARRKRLTPAQPGYLEGQRAPEVKSMPPVSAPIAQVAGDASARAALEELTAALDAARADGLMIELVPLEAVDEGHLVRDRMVQDEDELSALMESMRARGQQTPVEVIRLPGAAGEEPRYGLISGWRRLTALRRLHAETGEERFATIRARVIAPQTAQAAYVAMVEENEIRVNLSFYERARIAVQAMREGVYPDQRAALRGLFGNTTRSKRSKIGSFIPLVEAFDGDLKHPTAISEKLGLALARALLHDPEFVSEVRNRLASSPNRSAGEEMRILAAAIEERNTPAPKAEAGPSPERPEGKPDSERPAVQREYAAPGVSLSFHPGKGRIELTGPKVDAALVEDLRGWLAGRAG